MPISYEHLKGHEPVEEEALLDAAEAAEQPAMAEETPKAATAAKTAKAAK